ncbi:TIGR02300 family protein [Amaricoccus sp.]|uniref:TIGR02300 family protein n=1 Tax=Amaricoccus sp. TaxID=1872485 RepID=UPI00261B0E62|nr:TIGR02300 family protein [uncultured Amaricoccus sp.]
MPKDEWGVKRICPTCATRFYDLRTDPMTCPNCGAVFTIDSLTAVKAKALRPEKVKPEPVDLEDLPDLEADDEVIDADDDLSDEILEDEEDNVDLEDITAVGPDEEET